MNYKPDLKDDVTGDELYGETDGRDFTIDINSKHTKEVQECTLFHEAVHAALAVSGVTHIMSDKEEEAIVTCIEHAFSDIIDVYKLSIDISDSI